MIRQIVQWPDPVLSTPCTEVTRIDEGLLRLIDDMLETMYAAPGRGLAAPQVGETLRLFVMDTTWKEGDRSPVVMINPEILAESETRRYGTEGCLSIPGVTAEIGRAETVTMRWTTPLGDTREELLTGFAAICAQHEFDHLNGVVTFDRLSGHARAALEEAYFA